MKFEYIGEKTGKSIWTETMGSVTGELRGEDCIRSSFVHILH
jgi:hypothetical protein